MILGIIGMTILVSAYFLVISSIVSVKSKLYLGINIFASILLGIYAYSINSWPFIIINIVWILGTAYQMIANEREHKKSDNKTSEKMKRYKTNVSRKGKEE